MSVSVKIEAQGLNEALQAVDALSGAVTGEQVRQAMGAAMRVAIIDHFTELENDSVHHRSADRLGAEHSGFYAEAARGVQMPQIESEGISVGISKLGLRLRYYGGTVKPGKNISWKTGQPTKWLAIPNNPIAYGKRTQEFDFSGLGTGNLRFVYFRPDLAALVENLATEIKLVRGVFKAVASTIGAVIFWLKRSVTYKADPTVLPGSEELLAAAQDAGESQLVNIWERQLGVPA